MSTNSGFIWIAGALVILVVVGVVIALLKR